jgi:hypothetical protein
MAKKAAKRRTTARGKSHDAPTRKAFPMVGRNDLNRLLEQCLIYQNRASTATGAMGELVREAVDRKHLHAPAFGLIKRLHNLGNKDPGKLWLMLAHFDDMRTKSGLDRLAQKQGQLLPAIADEVEEQDEPSAENVVTYPREVPEQAGENAA